MANRANRQTRVTNCFPSLLNAPTPTCPQCPSAPADSRHDDHRRKKLPFRYIREVSVGSNRPRGPPAGRSSGTPRTASEGWAISPAALFRESRRAFPPMGRWWSVEAATTTAFKSFAGTSRVACRPSTLRFAARYARGSMSPTMARSSWAEGSLGSSRRAPSTRRSAGLRKRACWLSASSLRLGEAAVKRSRRRRTEVWWWARAPRTSRIANRRPSSETRSTE